MTGTVIDVEYEQPVALDIERAKEALSACDTRRAWARVPPELTPEERDETKARIRRLLRERNAVMVSHYYVHPDLQELAEETGGIVSDSLEMARDGTLRARSHGTDPRGLRRALHGRNGQDPLT